LKLGTKGEQSLSQAFGFLGVSWWADMVLMVWGQNSVSRESIISVLTNGTQERDKKAPGFQANSLAHCAHTCRVTVPLCLCSAPIL
jgi:hypothetical protein